MPSKKSRRYNQSISMAPLATTQGGGLFRLVRDLAGRLFGSSTSQGLSREEILEYHLTPREREVAYLVALGFTNKEIGDALVITAETVKTHVRNILSKMDLGSKVELRLFLAQYQDPSSPDLRFPSRSGDPL